jgi:hypothetical protein
MKVFASITLYIILNSCNQNFDRSCEKNFIGKFRITVDNLLNDSIKKLIINRGWDTIVVTSSKDGRYYFNSKDPILKKAEGTWRVISNGLDNGCTGAIKQNNLQSEIHLLNFSLSVEIYPGQYYGILLKKISN